MEQIMEWQQFLLDNPLFFAVIFVVGWIIVSLTFSRITGWNKLADRYRTYIKPDFKLFQAVPVSWGTPLIGGNIYTLGSTYKGLYLGVLFPFRIGHPPLLIPWYDIKVKRVQRFMSNKIVFELKNGLSRPIEIGENLAEKLKDESKGQLNY